jgi:ankyrin repeat protein
MSAAKYSTPEVVQVLIEAGANVNAKNKLGQTALMLADNKDNLWRREIVALLIEHGAKR